MTERGTFVTGGQTSGEVWTPPFTFAHRLGDSNQEFCTVYNMMRLAEFLFRWTGDPSYADYRELGLYNGVLAQHNATTGMVAYYLPLQSGQHKTFCTPTESFPCCLGTMVQAISQLGSGAYYTDGDSAGRRATASGRPPLRACRRRRDTSGCAGPTPSPRAARCC